MYIGVANKTPVISLSFPAQGLPNLDGTEGHILVVLPRLYRFRLDKKRRKIYLGSFISLRRYNELVEYFELGKGIFPGIKRFNEIDEAGYFVELASWIFYISNWFT